MERYVIIGLLCCWFHAAAAQSTGVPESDSLPTLAAQAGYFTDSIMVRWAPTNAQAWAVGNNYGYRVERYTLAANGEGIQEVKASQVKPWDLSEWTAYAQSSELAAIAAQALYGQSFEVDLGTSTDMLTVYQASQQEQLRFAFHLLAADQDPQVARMSGLLFVDTEVSADQEYLYEIISLAPDSLGGGQKAFALASAQDAYPLSPVENIQFQVQGNQALLAWEGAQYTGMYLGYYVERSLNGTDWELRNERPLVSVENELSARSPYRPVNFVDSVGDDPRLYYYRVRGRTIFGEYGPYSEVLSAQVGTELLTRALGLQAKSPDNQTAELLWAITDPQSNARILVERGPSRDGPFAPISDTLGTSTTQFVDHQPKGTNYYRLQVSNSFGATWQSPSVLLQLIDSVPPAVPSGLSGRITAEGIVVLDWAQNPESDVEGYRVFRANYLNEEPSQITPAPVPDAGYTDQIELQTLTEQIHYYVMAVDYRGNMSALSAPLTLDRPDKIAPASPIVHQYRAGQEGISFAWYPSASTDVERVVMYRMANGESRWRPVASFLPTDSAWVDSLVVPGQAYRYVLVAQDDAKNESPRDRYLQVRARKGPRATEPTLFVEVDREGRRIRLGWPVPPGGLQQVHIYRAEGEGQLVQLTTLSGRQTDYSDRRVRPNTEYQYAIQWVFKDGTQSKFSTLNRVTY